MFCIFVFQVNADTMAPKIEDFFIPSNAVKNITDEDYQKVDLLVNAAKAFARSTHQCVYIIDYFKKEFLYASENFYNLCGISSDKIKDFGYGFFTNLVPEQDQDMLVELNKAGFTLFETFPIEERMDYTISYDFHIIQGKKNRLINHKLTPLLLAKDGRIWLSLCTISMSARNNPGKIIIRKEKESFYYEYSLEKHTWLKSESIVLTETERDVLRLSAQGYTMNEISERIFKSIDTVKACKRSLFTKLDVRNIAEAVSYAVNYRLI